MKTSAFQVYFESPKAENFIKFERPIPLIKKIEQAQNLSDLKKKVKAKYPELRICFVRRGDVLLWDNSRPKVAYKFSL